MWWAILVSAALGYAVGSVQFGLIVSRRTRGIDVREYGSGATGATNVIRTSGAKAGVVVLLLDIAKGIVPVYAAIGIGHLADLGTVDDRAWCAAAAGLAAVIGHVWPVYHGFRGGKAVATGFGAALAMNPLASVALVPVAALVVGATRIMSVLSITMAPLLAAVFVVLAIIDVSPPAYAFYAVPAAAIILYRHSANIRRLLDGTEPKIGQGGDRRADAAPASTATESREPTAAGQRRD